MKPNKEARDDERIAREGYKNVTLSLNWWGADQSFDPILRRVMVSPVRMA